MERFSKADRPYAVAAAVAHDLNEELTVILNSVTRTIDALDPGHPAFPLLVDLLASAQRCAWRSSKLLNFCARKGYLAAPLSVQRLLDEESRPR